MLAPLSIASPASFLLLMGGQTLLSLAAEQLVRDSLPPTIGLRDLGEYCLKDLVRPEHSFQVSAPGLATDFPPLVTLDTLPNNLPRQVTPLVGREKELADLCGFLRDPDVALVTLTGPGGTGKTRLALQAGAEVLEDFPGGVWFVDLATITDPSLLTSTIAQTLSVTEVPGEPLLNRLKTFLADRHLLLILDNFEQLLQAAPLVADLVSASSKLKVLVTSREVLNLRGEHDYPVPPLRLPDPRNLPPVEQLSQYEAVQLFINRAVEAKPDFQVTNSNAAAVAEICVRLDGLPLAIELAAVRIRVLTPEAILSRLQSSLKLLTGGARDLPVRQQTLRGAIEGSYDLLDEGDKQ